MSHHILMVKTMAVVIVLAVCGIVLTASGALAGPDLQQTCGGTIDYGQMRTVRNHADWPHCDYWFQGKEGDRVTINVEVLSGNLQPKIQLYDGNARIFAEGNSTIQARRLDRGDGWYGFRVTSAVSPRTYGTFRVAVEKAAPPAPGPGIGGPPVGGSSGGRPPGGGSSGPGSNAGVGVDCQCSRTGAFVGAVAPEVTNGTSKDGKYRVDESRHGVFVFRVADNRKMLHLNTIAAIKHFGFGPNSRYFVLITSDSLIDPTTVTLWDVETGARLLRTVLAGSGGWGFSPDGRTFQVSGRNGGQLYLILVNTQSRKTRTLHWLMPHWAGWSFSPCGDVVATAVAPQSTGFTFIRLYRSADLGDLMSSPTTITGFWPGLMTTAQRHQTQQTPPMALASNTAGQVCR